MLYMKLSATISKRFDTMFPRPVEVRLVEILGGTTLTIGTFRRNGNPLTITLSRGRLLRSRRFRRAVVDGCGVLANDVAWAIRIMGKEYENDVVRMFEHDEYLEEHGWRLGYVREHDIWNNPRRVFYDMTRFIAA